MKKLRQRRLIPFLAITVAVGAVAAQLPAAQPAFAVTNGTVQPHPTVHGAKSWLDINFDATGGVTTGMKVQVQLPNQMTPPNTTGGGCYEEVTVVLGCPSPNTTGTDPRLYILFFTNGTTFDTGTTKEFCQAALVTEPTGSSLEITAGTTADAFATAKYNGANAYTPCGPPIVGAVHVRVLVGWSDDVTGAVNLTGLVNPGSDGTYPMSFTTDNDFSAGGATLQIASQIGEPAPTVIPETNQTAPIDYFPVADASLPAFGCPTAASATNCTRVRTEFDITLPDHNQSLASPEHRICISGLTIPRGRGTEATFTNTANYTVHGVHPTDVMLYGAGTPNAAPSPSGCDAPAVELHFTGNIFSGALTIVVKKEAGFQVAPESTGSSPYDGSNHNVGNSEGLTLLTDLNHVGFADSYTAYQTHILPPTQAVSAGNPIQGAGSSYDLSFTLGAGGNMQGNANPLGPWSGGQDNFTVQFDSPTGPFPSGTLTASNFTLKDITQNWSGTAQAASGDGVNQINITLPAPTSTHTNFVTAGGDQFQIHIASGAGVKNPAVGSPGGTTYHPHVFSNIELPSIQFDLIIFSGTAVKPDVVTFPACTNSATFATCNDAGDTAQYLIKFKLTSGLTTGDTITMTFPAAFGGFGAAPATLAANWTLKQVSGGTAVSFTPNAPSITTNGDGSNTVVLTVTALQVGANGALGTAGTSIQITAGSSTSFIINPTQASPVAVVAGKFQYVPSYALTINTNHDLAPTPDDGIAITATTPASASFIRPTSPDTISADVATYLARVVVRDANSNPTPTYIPYTFTYEDTKTFPQSAQTVTVTWGASKVTGAADTPPVGTMDCDGLGANTSTTNQASDATTPAVAIGTPHAKCTLKSSTTPGDQYNIGATAQGLSLILSPTLTVVAGAPTQAVISAVPASVIAGQTVLEKATAIKDSAHNTVNSGTLTFKTWSPGANLSNPPDVTNASVQISNGTASLQVTTLATKVGNYTFKVYVGNTTTQLGPTGAFEAFLNAYHPLPPVRIMDTRGAPFGPLGDCGAGPTSCLTVGPGGTISLLAIGAKDIHGVDAGIPATAVGLILNVTVADATDTSFVTVFPAGASPPNASNLNVVAGAVVQNLVSVKIGPNGRVNFSNNAGSVDVIADVAGFVGKDTTQGDGLFVPQAPSRILDTRFPPFGPKGVCVPSPCLAIGPGQTVHVKVTGQGSPAVPNTGVAAVVLNLTVTNTTAISFLSAFPTGSSPPDVSNLNWVPGQTVPNRAIVKVGTAGQIDLYNNSGFTDVLADVSGYITDGSDATAVGGTFFGAVPVRILDTRGAPFGPIGVCGGSSCPAAPVVGPGHINLNVGGQSGVPANAKAAILNVTVTNTTATSFLTVVPGHQTKPDASDLNWNAGMTIPNLVIVQLGNDGSVDIYNYAGSTDVIVDVVAWSL